MAIEQRSVKPAAGFSGELALYLGSLEEVRNRLRETAADLTAEELTRRAFPSAHQIGNLILHLGEAEAGWIWRNITGKEIDEDAKKQVHWCDTTERDFAEKAYSAQECLDRIDAISARSREILATFTDADLDKFFGFNRDDGTRIEVTLRWVLVHLLDHEAVHRGQISMLIRLLRGGEI
jgi:uncharacterized damage-inducible protein DinB